MKKGPHFNGPHYDPALDHDRLTRQIGRVYDLMIDGNWRTLNEIANNTGDPQASISAQLRHLRKERFGGYLVENRRRGDKGDGLFEYRVSKKEQKKRGGPPLSDPPQPPPVKVNKKSTDEESPRQLSLIPGARGLTQTPP